MLLFNQLFEGMPLKLKETNISTKRNRLNQEINIIS